jgi:hypothetical protein
MKKQLLHATWLMLAIILNLLSFNQVKATQLSGVYIIDTLGTPSATVFRNFSSAITYLTSADPRSDGGPSNSAPFGVSGPVIFNVAPGTYQEQVIIPNILGASDVARVTFLGNGAILQAVCNVSNYSVLRLSNADYITIKNLTIRTLDATYGWGIHFYLGSDYNLIDSCNIQITSVTSTSSANSAGIVFSNSLTSPTTSGANGYFNQITNNTIDGHPTSGGMYYGIVGFPATGATVISRNKFVNNLIRNFFYSGIYWGNSNGALFKNNTITRTTKTTLTTTYGFYLTNASRLDTFEANTITGVFTPSPTNTNTFYAFWGINYSGTLTEPNFFINNLVYGNRGNGSQFGFYFLTAFNNRFYNNTILFDHTANTSTTSQTIGFYWTGNTSATSTLDLRNNIFSITTGGTGPKHALFTTGTWTTGTTINKNGYFSNAANYNTVNYMGNNYATYNQWRTFISTIDQNSSDFNPIFTDASVADFRPREGWYAGNGDLVPSVTTYYSGAPRTPPMDIGAFPTNPLPLDVAAGNLILPATPYTAGSQPISVTIRNAGVATITSATINWSVNGTPQTPVAFTGSLTAGNTSSPISLGSVSVAQGIVYNIVATVSSPNSSTDGNPDNNTTTGVTAALLPGGTYTINSGGSGPANFTSFTAFTNLVNTGGIGGAITLNVTPASGPYTEQVFFREIRGLSLTNNIVINGNNQYVQFNNADAGSLGIINLIGVDHITFNNLNVRSLNASNGIGYLLTFGSDSNTIQNCIIDISSVTGGSNSAGIALTAGLNSPTLAGNNGVFNRFIGNNIMGGPTGGPYYAMVIQPTNVSNGPNNRTIVLNNMMSDFTVYGMYMAYTAGSMVSGNTITRPTKTSPTTFYGIYIVNNAQQDTFERNIITHSHGANPTANFTQYGIYPIATNTQATRQVIYRNNIISNLRGIGTTYAFYALSSSNFQFLHNNIVLDDPTSTATNLTYAYYNSGTPTTQTIRNNIFFINKGGSGVKVAMYLATVNATGYVMNNNCYHVKVPAGSTNNHVGFYNGANRTTLTDWLTNATFDLNSISADPQFRTWFTANPMLPGADSLNNKGFNVLSFVPNDFNGTPRTSTPDIGAYEFIVPGADAGITRIVSPTVSSVPLMTNANFTVRLRNFGANTLTSADINWLVDTNPQFPTSWFGTLLPGDTTDQAIGSYFVSSPGIYPVKIWTSNPNSVVDSFPQNDTVSMIICTPISGTITLNPSAPQSATNFTSWQQLAQIITNCGVDGPLTVNVSPGTYTGAVAFVNPIPGANATNRITINGGDSATTILTHNGAGQRPTLLLDNVRNLEFRNIKFETTAGSAGTAVQLINTADSNSFVKCAFVAPYSTATTLNAFVASGSVVSPTTLGNSTNHLLIDSCTARGGYYAIDLFGTTSPKSVNNIVRNSRVIGSHFYGIYVNYQNRVQIVNNYITDVGVAGNNIATNYAAISVNNSDGRIRVLRNEIQNQIAGRGIDLVNNLGTVSDTMVVANNMVNIGDALFTTYGIFESNNAYLDLAYNAIKLNTAEPNYAGAALYSSNTSPFTYNNIRIVNNIFTAPNGCLAVYIVNGANLIPASYTLDYNVYYSTSTYPFRVGGFITNTFTAFVTGTPNMLGTFLPGNNVHGQFFLPNFFSPTNLRSISPELDDSALAITSVVVDYDGASRNPATPDIGLIEFTKPAADAGVLAILSPSKPMATGWNDVVVLIKNFGINTLTSVDVTYQIDSVTHTRSYTGTLLPNAVDTIRFDSTSGPGSSSQQFNFPSHLVNIKAWTSNPNATVDSLRLNDTAYASICGSLAGTYTIDPAGSGPSNFTSIQAAIDKLVCGGVASNVVFNIAPGTYTGQYTIPTIAGVNDSTRITFKSATNNASAVTITSSTASAAANYTIRLLGARYIRFEHLTINNTNGTFARVIAINKEATTNTNTSFLEIRNCNLTGVNTTSTADQYAVVFGPGGDNATFLSFVGNTITNGSFGIWVGGQNIVNQNAPGLNIDSNTFNNQYYVPIWLTNRFLTNIRGNNINCHPTFTSTYGIYISGFGQQSEISRNIIINPAGLYGIYIGQNAYYDMAGLTTLHNNVIHLQGTTTQYGLFIANSSKLRIYNNTVRLTTASTSYALYHQAHASFVTGGTTYPAAYDIHIKNNIFTASTNGYCVYNTNVQANLATTDVSNNLYWSTFATPFSMGGTTYTPAQFFTTYRNSLYAGFERKSIFGEVVYTSPTNSRLNATHPSAWLANGRAQHLFFNTADITGAPRSNDITTGVPDIGAYEINPTSLPAPATLTGTTGYGSTQHIVQYNDTLAAITWSFFGNLPTSVTARYFPGSLISHPNTWAMTNLTNKMDMFLRIEQTGGSFFDYNLRMFYDSVMMGTVSSQTELKLAQKDTTGWVNYPGFLTTVDTIAKHITVNNLLNMGDFTGTDDINPLPITLTSFEAVRKGRDAELSWTTASEINASHFVVERSVNGRVFEPVSGRIKAEGNARTTARYHFVDEQVVQNTGVNTVYYRLRMVDMDGTSENSMIRRVTFENRVEAGTFVTYPNPFNDQVTLTLSTTGETPATVEVFDIFGKKVSSFNLNTVAGEADYIIDNLRNLGSGVYIVKIAVDAQLMSTKLIKN